MIIGIGVDIIEINRIKKAAAKNEFLSRCFSSSELSLFESKNNNPQTVAANFCAKEAFSKALGTGIRGFNLTDISVLRNTSGKPYITTTQRVSDILSSLGVNNIFISLSHCNEYAVAQVVLES